MKQKTLVILTVATLGTIALAAISISHRDGPSSADAAATSAVKKEKDILFPGLLAKLNDVTTVTIKQKAGEYTLVKSGDAWGLLEKDKFAIEIDPVRKMLIAIGQMQKLEAKTADKSRYDSFGVQDPGVEGSTSALVTLKDASGAELAQLVLGKEHESKGAAVSNQRYVRKGGDAQTWLVQGTFDLKEKGSDLLEKKIVEVKRDRVRSVEITQPDGEFMAVERASASLTDFTLLDIPEGKELTYPTAPGSVASGLEYVNLEDVEPMGKIDFTSAPGPTAKFKTFDGLVVTVATKDQDGKAWANFVASYEAPPAEAAPPAPKEGEAPKPETPKMSAEDVQKEVAELNARLSKWTYQISTYTRANLGKKKVELLKDKPPPVDPNAPADPNKDAYKIPSTLPPEIQAQIKADQEAKGNKVVIEAPKPKDGAPPVEHTPTPTPADPPH